MKYFYSLFFVIFILISCNPTNDINRNVKRDLAITVSTEVGKGTFDHVGEATGRVQRTDAFLSIFVPSYRHEHSPPWSMKLLFYNIRGVFFHNPSTIEESNKKYGNWGGKISITTNEGHEDITVKGGTFPQCLKQKTVVTVNDVYRHTELKAALINGARYLWFAEGVGIVKIRYEHSNGIVTEAELIDYKIAGKSDEYFPLTSGTTWTYRWQDDFYKQPLIDTITVEPRKPYRGAFPLKVEVTSEAGEEMGSGSFEVTKHRMSLELSSRGSSYSGNHKGRDLVPGSTTIFDSHLSSIWSKLLEYPLRIGNTWEQEGLYNSRVQSTLVGYETVDVGPNKYQMCLKQKSVFSGATTESDANEETLQRIAMINGTRYIWYAKGIGIVKMIYEHSNGVITEAELAEYVIPEKSNEYFPLDLGTSWTYTWQNDYHIAPMTEKVRVVEEGSGHETQLKKAHYVVNISADKPGEAHIECKFTTEEVTGNKIRLRPSSDDVYIIGHTIKMEDSTKRRAGKLGGAGSWDFKFRDGYLSPLTMTYDVSIEHAQRIRTFRENQGWPQHLRYQTMEPDHKQDRTFWTGKALFIVGGTNRDIKVSFNLPKGWLVSTPWRSISRDNTRFAVSNQSELISSLILIGQHSELIARSGKTKVTIAIAGDLRPFEDSIHDTVEKYLSTYLQILKRGPDENVLFIINPYETHDLNGSEGRGITRSVSILMDNWLDETNRHLWGPFLGHEVFHIWNGLTALQAFSGHEHWFVEGVTDYYSDMASLHLGYLTEREYLNRIEAACESYLSVSNEYAIGDARDTRLSYDGGRLIALALDHEIREHKKNRKSLDNVMQLMYKKFDDIDVEYTQSDIIKITNKVSGEDFLPFFQEYVEGKARLPLTDYFGKAGLDLQVTSEELPTSEYVMNVLKSSIGQNKNVEVVGINGSRIGNMKELRKIAKHWILGEVVTLLYEDNGKTVTNTTTLKGVSETPPTENEIVVHIIEKPDKTKLQQVILSDILGRN